MIGPLFVALSPAPETHRRSIRDLAGRAAVIPRLVFRTGEKDSRTRTLISLSHHRGHRDRMGISSFSSELRVFLFPFFLPIAWDQIADRSPRSPGALVLRT